MTTTASFDGEWTRTPARARPIPPSFRRRFAYATMLLFLCLRVLTWGPPVEMRPDLLVIPNARPNLPMTIGGSALVTLMIAADPALAFAFVVCDMNGFGALFDLDQWGVAGVFKFRDLEMGVLLAFGFLFWLRRPAGVRERRTRLRRYLAGVAVTITAITVLYTVATLRFQDFSTTVRYSRQLYVWLIVLAAPQFIRTRRNVERVAAFLAAYAGFSAVLYVAQAVTPPQTVLRYSQQLTTGGQTRVWATSLSAIYVGGLAIFAYQLRRRHSRGMLWICFSACSLAIVMSQGRMLTGVFAVSIAAMLLHRAIVTHRIGLAVRVAATAAVLIVVCTAILWSANRLDPLLDAWNHRLGELEVDVKAHEGSWTSRSAMFQYLPLVVERNGGGLLASCFGMGFRALTPADLAPMTFWGVISPPLWADNGLAGVTFTFGYFGLGLFFLFVATMVWRLAAQFTRAGDPLSRSITLTAMLYFTFILPYMFFSAAFMGVWDDALAVVVMLIMAERSAALRPRRAFPA